MMALINCPECGNKISDQAEACPKCGYELKEKKTVTSDHLKEIKSKWNNKYLIIIALVVGAFFLLNQPNRQSKEKAYQRRNKEFLSKIKKENTQEGLLDKGQNVLEKLNKIIK